MTDGETAHILDNPAWYALTDGEQARLAIGTARAKRYPLDVAPFVGLIDYSVGAFADMATLVEPGQWVGLVGRNLPKEVPGWTTVFAVDVDQMVCEQPILELVSAETVLDLTPADVPDMLHLIELAQPGPFFQRTIELGHYVGIRKDGQLVAMAGERLRPPGYCEVSAVCSHPDYRGRGYARLLVSKVVAWNWRRGDLPFLHVAPENASAIRLYESLHFQKRRDITILVVSR